MPVTNTHRELFDEVNGQQSYSKATSLTLTLPLTLTPNYWIADSRIFNVKIQVCRCL